MLVADICDNARIIKISEGIQPYDIQAYCSAPTKKYLKLRLCLMLLLWLLPFVEISLEKSFLFFQPQISRGIKKNFSVIEIYEN